MKACTDPGDVGLEIVQELVGHADINLEAVNHVRVGHYYGQDCNLSLYRREQQRL
jgi:hypothetical protein